MTSAGFGDAPVTRALIMATGAASVFAQSFKAAERSLPSLLRAAAALFAFSRPGEMVSGIGLLYCFREIERRIGSGKFGAQVAVVSGILAAVKLMLGALRWRWGAWAPGPTPLITSFIVPFALFCPPLQHFDILRLKLDDKVFVYLAILQLLFSAPQQSLPAGLAGLIAGVLYHANLAGMQRFSAPHWILAMLGAPNKCSSVRHAAMQHAQQAQTLPPHQLPSQARSIVQISPAAVQSLIAMGYSQQSAETALMQVGGSDVHAAIEQLTG